MKLATRLIHAGEPEQPFAGAVSMPIFQSSTFLASGSTDYHDLKYIRLNNTPNHQVLHAKLAALENAEAALVTASGMAAITTTLLALLKSGDHFLAQDCLYGGTLDFINQDLPGLGIECDLIDGQQPETWKSCLRPNTRAIYVETITNPLMQVIDLEKVVSFARQNGLVSIVDNTFASPINFRPAEIGFDISLHSCTKYLNGHSDIVAGAVIGRRKLVESVRHKLNHFGASLDPHACFLLHRGLKTLAVRMAHQNRAALVLARFLADHPMVAGVNYPGLAQDPYHAMASKLLDGFSGMLSFEINGDRQKAIALMEALEIPFCAPSLGGVESLVTRPATTSHAGMTPDQRAAAGISDQLIRVSVGLEDPEDLVDDYRQALEKIG